MPTVSEISKKLPPVLTRNKETLLAAGGAFFLCAASLGGAHPFGLALLCSCRKRRLPVFVGNLLGAVFCGRWFPMQILCALGCFLLLTIKEARGAFTLPEMESLPLLRALLTGKLQKKEASDLFRASAASAAGAVLALAYLAREGIPGGLLPAACLTAVPVFTLLYGRLFTGGKLYELALLGLAFSVSQIFRPIVLFGAPLSLAVGTVFTLLLSRSRGFAFGCAAGVLCGLTAGSGAVGALGVTGITYGLLAANSEYLALALAYLIAAAGLWYLSPSEVLLSGAAMLLAGILLFLPLRHRVPLKLPARPIPTHRNDSGLATLAAAFSSLSGLFYTVSENATPRSVDDVVQNIRSVVSSFCKNCDGCELSEGELCACFTDLVREQGAARTKDLPLHITRRCPSIRQMTRAINDAPEARAEECGKGIRRMASEYAGMSSLLAQAARTEEETRVKDKPAAAKVLSALKTLRVDCSDVSVTGKRIRTVEVFGVRLSAVSSSAERIRKTLSEALSAELTEPEFFLHGDFAVMKLTSAPCLRVEYAGSRASKAGEKVSGDTVSFFETNDGHFYCLLSDGMGSGRDAALVSRLAAIMLEKLLTMGADKAEAIRMLNDALLEKEKEIFATIDLLEIDRYTGQAVLIKAGAAPTMLLRRGTCRRFEAKTPPAGILRDVIAEKRTFRLQKGDLLLMLSDGVLQTEDPPTRLPLPADRSAHSYCSAVLSAARKRTAAKDDMAVCAVRVY